ncbi:MAG: galactose ABC transporter substrate-binding protein [Christensenellaceae bacterium]|nr:galactose ABC transporter substrate-binding protein [Christensenellaceae bacterium]
MKKVLLYIFILFLSISTVFAGSDIIVGVHIYRFDDTFMAGVRDIIKSNADGLGDCKIIVTDGKGSQPTQNDLIINSVKNGAKAQAINIVDVTAAPIVLQKLQKLGVPAVFFNREPDSADMPDEGWFYVGAMAEESGRLCGGMIADYFEKNPTSDLNRDGIIQYVLLMGERGHQDTIYRSEYSVRALQERGYRMELVAAETANWQRVQAQEKMSSWLNSYSNIEAVICNNDDMALGAIDALKAAGYFTEGRYIPVVGVDATAPAIEALKEGTLLGTVLNDAKNIGKATFQLSCLLAKGEEINQNNFDYTISNGRYVWIPYKKVTKDNYMDFER